MKSIFDIDCDALQRKLRHLEKREQDGKPVADAIPVSRDTLAMLLEDHYDLLKVQPRQN